MDKVQKLGDSNEETCYRCNISFLPSNYCGKAADQQMESVAYKNRKCRCKSIQRHFFETKLPPIALNFSGSLIILFSLLYAISIVSFPK
jgi:hypothetical protein